MAINKVVYGNQTLMDLTSDTVTEQDVAQGVTFHDASGTLRTGSASGGSGHIIEDRDGNALTQRAIMKFVDGLKATDDSTNGKTIVSDNPDEYTWEQWNQLSKQEQDAIPNALITNVPDVDGGIQADLMTKLWENDSPSTAFAAQSITLASSDYDFLLFICGYQNTNLHNLSEIVTKGYGVKMEYATDTGYSYTINRTRLITRTDDTTYYVNSAYTQNANGSRSVDNNFIIPLVIYGIKKTINLEFSAIASGVSTSADKCMLEDEVTNMQDVTDSIAPTDTTPATAAHAIGEQFYFNGQLVTATAAIAIGDTIAVGTNCTTSGTVTEQIQALKTPESVSVTADGVKTYQQILNSLYSLLDVTKITYNSYLKYGNYIYRLTLNMEGLYQYTVASIASSNTFIQKLSVNASSSGCERMSGTTFTDLTTQKPTNGSVFTIYY